MIEMAVLVFVLAFLGLAALLAVLRMPPEPPDISKRTRVIDREEARRRARYWK